MTRPYSEQPAGATDREPSQPASPNSPGDEAPPGTPGTGETVCRDCGGSGRKYGATCRECGGTGRITEGIDGA